MTQMNALLSILWGCVHNFILAVSLFDRQYISYSTDSTL